MLRMFTSVPSYGILLLEMAHGTEEIATDRCPDLLETECASYVPTVTANCSMNILSKETVFIQQLCQHEAVPCRVVDRLVNAVL
jgi:hypothetical protein